MSGRLRVVILKPGKYRPDGFVERFRWGFMPNSTLPYMRGLTPDEIEGVPIEVHGIDEYVYTDTDYLNLLRKEPGEQTLLALVGVQAHQFHRALDLAALATQQGCMAVIGGPYPMTCDTSALHGCGVSFALAEAELIWPAILRDAVHGELAPVYGTEQRWQAVLHSPITPSPSRRDLRRYVVPMLGLYPARGCLFQCSFCSVIKIAGRKIRSQSIDTTLGCLREARKAGVRLIMFTSDNFNKYPEAKQLLEAICAEKLNIKFFVQCDAQVARQEELIALMARAGCFQMFVGVESFNRDTLLSVKKRQNRPETYQEIVRLCRKYDISAHFSNIIGFPQDNETDVHAHLEVLREIDPTWASFYILCPIPGTEQYAEFLDKGLIVEENLDRFDTTSLTWKHPNFSNEQLTSLLYECYQKFYSFPHALENVWRLHLSNGNFPLRAVVSLATSAFHRYSAFRHWHPMSGGIKPVQLDSVAQYMPLRCKTYGFHHAPLPRNLA